MVDACAGQQVVGVECVCEGVKGHQPDVCVVTDDAGQRCGVQSISLSGAEHTFILPPEPKPHLIVYFTDTLKLNNTQRTWNITLPVTVSERFELFGDQAGQQRPHAAPGQSRL